ncbi:MAG TPA: biotin transporter BioY [Bacillota bacterium]|nr:biotin transporter BioY [Bacillota bacterium]
MNQQSKLQLMITIALFATIIGVFSQITIPLPLIPITGQTLAIGLAATIMGSRNGTAAVILYIIIGSIGIPVFAQFSAGLGVVVGPTGGFLVGFIPTAFIIGLYLEKTSFTIGHALIANVLGMFITLCFGMTWLKISAQLSWGAAFMSGFAPFLIVGLIKAYLAASIGVLVRQRLKKAKLLFATTS